MFRFYLAALFPALLTAAAIRYDAAGPAWTLTSGDLECRIGPQDSLAYLGPAREAPWKTSPPARELALVSQRIQPNAAGVPELVVVWKHTRLPIEWEVRYTAWGDTGVFTREPLARNTGGEPLRVDWISSLDWRLPAGAYDLTYLFGGWGRERQVAAETLGPGRRAFVSNRGRSTNGYSPWFALRNEQLGVRYLAQLAWSGNWEMSFERHPDRRPLGEEPLDAAMSMRFDGGRPPLVRPGEALRLPRAAFTASTGDLDDAANRLHRFQRQYVIARTAANDPLLVQFNSWYPFRDKIKVADMKRCVDVAAALGAEVFVLDAGWFNKKNWSRELGDWRADPVAFPKGLEELANYVRAQRLKFGLWVEIENLGVESQTLAEHPGWCLARNGRPILRSSRCHLDFAKPEVRQWARATIDRLARDYGLEWLKIDYNIDIGDEFDGAGDALYRHLLAYYGWLDDVRAAHPGMVIENCSSGGLRFDLGMLAHTHTTWLSDEVRPIPSVQLAYGCSLEFAPEVCNHWMVGDEKNGEVPASSPPGWWDFLFRVPMNGQFGISSRVMDWSPELKSHAAENVALYKRLRTVIRGADVYHLTPPPAHDDPAGWMAIEYAAPDRAALLAYRLAKSSGEQVFRLRGLDDGRTYRVIEAGRDRGRFTGQTLRQSGLPVKLDAEWRAAAIELEPIR